MSGLQHSPSSSQDSCQHLLDTPFSPVQESFLSLLMNGHIKTNLKIGLPQILVGLLLLKQLEADQQQRTPRDMRIVVEHQRMTLRAKIKKGVAEEGRYATVVMFADTFPLGVGAIVSMDELRSAHGMAEELRRQASFASTECGGGLPQRSCSFARTPANLPAQLTDRQVVAWWMKKLVSERCVLAAG